MSIRMEAYIDIGDDTMANGLKIQCSPLDEPNASEEFTIFEGEWGDWLPFTPITEGYFIQAVSVKNEFECSYDCTGINGIKIISSKAETSFLE